MFTKPCIVYLVVLEESVIKLGEFSSLDNSTVTLTGFKLTMRKSDEQSHLHELLEFQRRIREI